MRTGRRLRAVSLAAVVLILGAFFHALAGGSLPHPVWLAVLSAATLLGSWRWTAVRPDPARYAIATVGGQALVHAFLTSTAGHGHADANITDPVALALHRISEDLTLAHAPMALAHAAAAAGVGLWLACGDRVLSLLIAVIDQWWRRIAPAATAAAPRITVPRVGIRITAPARSALRTPLTRRGPPTLRSA